MVKGVNNNIYHFKTYIINKDNTISDINYYISAKELCKYYNISRATVYNIINNPINKSPKLSHIRIEKVRIPTRILVENPIAVKNTYKNF